MENDFFNKVRLLDHSQLYLQSLRFMFAVCAHPVTQNGRAILPLNSSISQEHGISGSIQFR